VHVLTRAQQKKLRDLEALGVTIDPNKAGLDLASLLVLIDLLLKLFRR